MKDRQAVTEQWFSVHTRAGADALAPVPGIDVVGAARHARKLRRGELAGNRFRVRMTGVRGDRWAERLGQVRASGAPNYFGAQRFGRDNLGRARAWLGERRRRRTGAFRAGLYRSVLRSFLFNEVLAARVAADTWNARLPGDVTAEPGDPSGMAPPTGPLWGRGRSPASDAALAVEQAALAPHGEIREGLEHAGLRQERRALVLRPRALTWAQDGASVDLAFELPPGTYATALLAEVFDLTGAAEAAP